MSRNRTSVIVGAAAAISVLALPAVGHAQASPDPCNGASSQPITISLAPVANVTLTPCAPTAPGCTPGSPTQRDTIDLGPLGKVVITRCAV